MGLRRTPAGPLLADAGRAGAGAGAAPDPALGLDAAPGADRDPVAVMARRVHRVTALGEGSARVGDRAGGAGTGCVALLAGLRVSAQSLLGTGARGAVRCAQLPPRHSQNISGGASVAQC